MTREETRDEVLKMNNPNILCEIVTGFGKSKIALDWLNKLYPNTNMLRTKVLVVVWRNVLIQNWKEQFIEWGYSNYLPYVEFVTYVSLHKKAGSWDFVIFDECHHLSERCIEALDSFDIKHSILLSATVKKDLRFTLQNTFRDLGICKVGMKEAIEDAVLPDPRVYLIPLFLDNKHCTFQIVKNKNRGNPVVVEFKDRFKWKNVKNRRVIVKCTQAQYYNDMSGLIEWHRRLGGPVHKQIYLRLCGERLKWLSDQKTRFVQSILTKLNKERTLTFCNSIEQTETLGTYCINSKNKDSQQILQDFNSGRVAHITACNMLDEGGMTPQFF